MVVVHAESKLSKFGTTTTRFSREFYPRRLYPFAWPARGWALARMPAAMGARAYTPTNTRLGHHKNKIYKVLEGPRLSSRGRARPTHGQRWAPIRRTRTRTRRRHDFPVTISSRKDPPVGGRGCRQFSVHETGIRDTNTIALCIPYLRQLFIKNHVGLSSAVLSGKRQQQGRSK